MGHPRESYDDSFEERLQKIILDNGENLGSELAILKNALEWVKKPVITVDVITPTDAKFREILNLIAAYFSATKVIEGRSVGTEQYEEVRGILSQDTGIIVVVDTNTRNKIPFDGWLHSQDQGMKEGRQDFQKITTERDTHVILVRFHDSSDKKQLLAALSPNDFLDAQIKCTT